MSHPSLLGALIAPDSKPTPDAIHVPILPLTAGPTIHLRPGEPFTVDAEGRAIPSETRGAHGIVDPFLQTFVRPGERFYGLLAPGSVTKLRHEFDHPLIKKVAPQVVKIVREVEKIDDPELAKLADYMKQRGVSADTIIGDADYGADDSCRGCY